MGLLSLWWLILAIVAGLVSGASPGNFRQKLDAQASTSNKLFHEALLKQLAASRLSTTDTRPDAAAPMIDDLNVLASAANSSTATTTQVDATTIGFSIYTGNTLPANPAPPMACATALMATIQCNSTIPLMAVSPTLFDDSDLTTVCTSTCTSSLASYRANVLTACKGYTMILDTATNATYAPTLAVDYISGPYTLQCLKDPTSGDYCTDVIKGYNAPAGISSLPKAELCSYCVLATMNATLLNSVSFSVAMEALYDSTATTCGIPEFNPALVTSPIVSPGTPGGVNSTSTISAQCALLGRNVTVSAAYTCAAVATQYSVSLYDVYSYVFGLIIAQLVSDSSSPSRSNSLPQTDCTVAAGTTLCLPQACTTYTVATNDTCAGIATAASLTTVQLQLYNPSLGSTCQFLSQQVGNLICVGPHGGFPSVSATSAAIAPSGTATGLAPLPTPTAVGSTAACGEWAVAVAGDFCSTFALRYSVTLADLYTMNPEINANCTNLLAAFYYCVEPYPPFSTVTTSAIATTGTNYSTMSTFSYSFPTVTSTLSYETLTAAGVPAPTNVAPGTRTAACGYYYNIEAGDTLASIANISDMAEAELVSWNSGMVTLSFWSCSGGSCPLLPELATAVPAVGEAICVIFPTGNYTLIPVTPPENVSPFATTACADYYTTVANDSCDSIAAAQDITSAQFLALNPGLTCAGLLAGVAYCDFPLTPVPTGPPSNLASGSLTNCTSYYTARIILYSIIASGDTCTSVDEKYDTALVDLLRWNTALTAACTTIALGEAYCVAGGGDACTKVYTVASGDSCGAIETKFNITLNDIIAWNPFLTSSCAIQIGENLCVAGTPSTGSSGPPPNIAAGTLTNCTTYYTIASGDTCTSVDGKYDIALADLLRWNTALTAACTTIGLGSAYCVAGGGDACSKIYTVVSGDSCGAIESKFGITLDDIVAWNPFLTSSCAIQIGQNLCVSGTPSTGTPPSGPPANIASGTLTNCTTYYTLTLCKIASGDTCTSVDEKYDIALADLLRWNTALTASCTGIGLGEAYCVAGGGSRVWRLLWCYRDEVRHYTESDHRLEPILNFKLRDSNWTKSRSCCRFARAQVRMETYIVNRFGLVLFEGRIFLRSVIIRILGRDPTCREEDLGVRLIAVVIQVVGISGQEGIRAFKPLSSTAPLSRGALARSAVGRALRQESYSQTYSMNPGGACHGCAANGGRRVQATFMKYSEEMEYPLKIACDMSWCLHETAVDVLDTAVELPRPVGVAVRWSAKFSLRAKKRPFGFEGLAPAPHPLNCKTSARDSLESSRLRGLTELA
ncbi:hypothetical protein B0H12DRAFT_1217298 [Mycena haematopus]|nr:hypothetical protein B0H12DRAFT_1217298 [Mycena haematopus]